MDPFSTSIQCLWNNVDWNSYHCYGGYLVAESCIRIQGVISCVCKWKTNYMIEIFILVISTSCLRTFIAHHLCFPSIGAHQLLTWNITCNYIRPSLIISWKACSYFPTFLSSAQSSMTQLMMLENSYLFYAINMMFLLLVGIHFAVCYVHS